ncbi:MAG: branched-chain amino acid ABC transporter permease [Deltaproteobacteria bacterium]|nr:branched-chain amino acid ABC transporter permease [Deltaproteobacteria bacterium]
MAPFLLWQVLASGLLTGLLYALLAAGFALLFGIVRTFNLAHGELLILSGYLALGLRDVGGLPLMAAVPLVAAAAAGLALLLHQGVARLQEPRELGSLVFTFGASLALQGLMLLIWQGNYRLLLAEALEAGVAIGPVTLSAKGLLAAMGSLLLIGGLAWFLGRTLEGKALRAVSLNREGASLMGIHLPRAERLAFAIGGGLAGVAGLLYALIHALYPAAGLEPTLIALTLTILAGVGRLGGLLAGGLLLGVLEAAVVLLAGGAWRELAIALFLLLVLRLSGTGLLGRRRE